MLRACSSILVLVAVTVTGCQAPTVASQPALTPSPVVATPAGVVAVTPCAPVPRVPMPSAAWVDAPSDRALWVSVGERVLFFSADQGATWQQRHGVTCSTAPGAFSFSDSAHGWIIDAHPPETQCNAQQMGLWRTIDGAQTWRQMAPVSIAASQCKEGLHFVDAMHGFLSAYDPNRAPVVYRTSDAGASWTGSSPLPDPPGWTSSPAGFTLRVSDLVTASGAVLVRASGCGSPANGCDQERSFAYASKDGGATFQFVAEIPHPEYAFAFVSAERWIQIAPSSGSRETTDAGATWRPFTTDYSQAAPVAPSISFATEMLGYATVRGQLMRTEDGGANWTGLTTPGT
ncbi:MAG: WD40/YVTN/BNR-like repeat-containing protein [Candidatus Dormibacteria bacterium]